MRRCEAAVGDVELMLEGGGDGEPGCGLQFRQRILDVVRVQPSQALPSSPTMSPATMSKGVADPVHAVRERALRSGISRRSPDEPQGLGRRSN